MLTILRLLFPFSLATVFICFTVHASPASATNEQGLSEKEKSMVAWIDQREAVILDELKTHVGINTGTANIAGLDQYRELLDGELQKLGFATETRSSAPLDVLGCEARQQPIADHLVATMKGSRGKKLLLNGHMDTVFSKEDEYQELQVLDDGTLRGPGIADMKGGIVVMLTALRALKAQNLLSDARLTVLFNSDEEIGSLGSRELIEELAAQHELGLVFEGTANNKMTRSRKGLGQARYKIIGRESHAGAAHQDGVSANLEMAHKVIQVEGLTDYEKRTTVNVGVMAGGEKRNTIPGCAEAYIDMRFPTQDAGENLKAQVEQLASTTTISNPAHPDFPKIEHWAVLHRPVKEPHPEVDNLIQMATEISMLVGEPITGSGYSGGGTDGSIAQAAGLPTVDSLGLNGLGAHSSREQSNMQSVKARSKLAAIMIARLISE